MKNKNVLLVMATLPMILLSSCKPAAKEMTSEDAASAIDAVVAKYAEGCPQKATVYSSPSDYDHGNFTATIDRGHYYHYHTFAMLILIPLVSDEYYYEKDGLYYHIHTSASRNVHEIISKEAFDEGMQKGEDFIWKDRAGRMLSLLKDGTSAEYEGEFSYKYTTTGEGQISLVTDEKWTVKETSSEQEVDVAKSKHQSINFKDNLPYDWIVETKSGNDKSKYKTSFDWKVCEETYPSNLTSVGSDQTSISWVDRR